jgi:MFS family permease
VFDLRSYQQAAVDQVRDSFRAGRRRPLLVAPTGSGKTVMFSFITASAAAKGNRTLILVHRAELLEQCHRALASMDVPHGLIAAGLTPERHQLTQVASVQTLIRRFDRVVLALNGVMICLMEVPMATGLKHWPVKRVLALGYILMGASFLIFLISGSLAAFVTMMVIFTFGEMSAFSRQQAYSASLAPEDMRGRYVGFLSFAWCAGNTASSALGMPLYDHHPSLLWMINATLGLVAAFLILSSRKIKAL